MVRYHRDRVRDVEPAVRHNARRDSGHEDVEHGANKERADDADRHVTLRIFCLLGRGANGVEPYIGEEDNTGARHDTAPAEVTGLSCVYRNERMPVRRGDRMKGAKDK